MEDTYFDTYGDAADDGRDEMTMSCGCYEYHMADCPLMTGGSYGTYDSWYDDDEGYWSEEDEDEDEEVDEY